MSFYFPVPFYYAEISGKVWNWIHACLFVKNLHQNSEHKHYNVNCLRVYLLEINCFWIHFLVLLEFLSFLPFDQFQKDQMEFLGEMNIADAKNNFYLFSYINEWTWQTAWTLIQIQYKSFNRLCTKFRIKPKY